MPLPVKLVFFLAEDDETAAFTDEATFPATFAAVPLRGGVKEEEGAPAGAALPVRGGVLGNDTSIEPFFTFVVGVGEGDRMLLMFPAVVAEAADGTGLISSGPGISIFFREETIGDGELIIVVDDVGGTIVGDGDLIVADGCFGGIVGDGDRIVGAIVIVLGDVTIGEGDAIGRGGGMFPATAAVPGSCCCNGFFAATTGLAATTGVGTGAGAVSNPANGSSVPA